MEEANRCEKGWNSAKSQEPWVDLMKAEKTKYYNYESEWLKFNN
jgi:hypothetical protein